MRQLHNRLKFAKVKLVLDWYQQGYIGLEEALAKLGVKRRRFYRLLKEYRAGNFTRLKPRRPNKHRRIPLRVESAIRAELTKEKLLISDPDMPLEHYNYQAIRDTVVDGTGLKVSAQTVRNRARAWGYYLERPKPKLKHTRVVLTTATGLLLQHDASHHKWSPFAASKWCLITTIDDYSRMLVYARLFEEESAWNHILALKHVILTYGVGGSYYTDNHSIFRNIQKMDGYWHTSVTVQETKTRWEQVVRSCGMDTIYAMSPEAKGKVERPYRWLQDRVVRACAKAKVVTLEEAQLILDKEVERYNNRQIHSTTGEIPAIRFKRAEEQGNTVFKSFKLPTPYTSNKDIFCLKEFRSVNGYGQVSWNRHYLKMPKTVPEGAKVELHILPISSHPEVRVWYKDELVTTILLKPTHK